ncbi:MAG: hypothetical protein V1819_02770 [bacterium]
MKKIFFFVNKIILIGLLFLLSYLNSYNSYGIFLGGKNIAIHIFFVILIFFLLLDIKILLAIKKKSLESGNKFIGLSCFFFLIFIIGISFASFPSCCTPAHDSRIIAAIAQLRTSMTYIQGNDNNFDKFSCSSLDTEIKMTCNEIDKNYNDPNSKKPSFSIHRKNQIILDGKEPMIAHFPQTNSQSACIYAPLNEKSGTTWYCADSTGRAGRSSVNPGLTGFCVDGQSAICPPAQG